MKIRSILSYNFSNNKTESKTKEKQVSNYTINTFTHNGVFAYRDYSLSFGERLKRTPENFYAQPFNLENMPATVKKYLFEDFEERHHMPPAQLQREAYQYLSLADSVDDVKEIYDEFDDLRSFEDTRPSKGIFLLLKWDKQTSNTPIFKDDNNKDLTVYLLRKVYLEGKTIDEINKDFDKDSTDAIKRELGVKDSKYFTASNLRTLGIHYPNLSYYNSFLATRNDKEYIPPVRTGAARIVSEETRQKISEASKTWWAGLNELERIEQIKKMMEGREYADTIIDKFRGPIMTLAAGKMNFSEKLSQIFSEKLSDEIFREEFPQFEDRQREIMLEFWNEDPEFRKNYTITLKSIIEDFDFAYSVKNESPEYLEDLLNQALEQKNFILEKAKLKRREYTIDQSPEQLPSETEIQADSSTMNNEETEETSNVEILPVITAPSLSSNEIYKSFKHKILSHLDIYSKLYKEKMFEFVMRNTNRDFKAQFITNYNSISGETNIDEKMKELHNRFAEQNPLLAITNRIVMASVIYDITGDEKIFLADNYELSKQISDKYQEIFNQKKASIDKTVNNYTKFSPRTNVEEFYTNSFIPTMIQKLNFGFDYINSDNTNEENKNKILELQKNKFAPSTDDWVSELQKHSTELRFICTEKNDEKARNIVFEKLIDELLDWQTDYVARKDFRTQKTKVPKYKNPQIMLAINNAINTNKFLNINPNSLTSLKIAYGKYLNDNYLKYCNEEYKTKLIDYSISHPSLDKNTIIVCLTAGTGALDKIYNKRFSHDITKVKKEDYQEIENEIFSSLINDFKRENPQLSNATEYALKQTLSEVSDFDPSEIYRNNFPDLLKQLKSLGGGKLLAAKDLIEERTAQYSEELTSREINDFVLNYSIFIKQDDKSFENFLRVNRGAVEYIKNENNSDKVRDEVMERLLSDYLHVNSQTV